MKKDKKATVICSWFYDHRRVITGAQIATAILSFQLELDFNRISYELAGVSFNDRVFRGEKLLLRLVIFFVMSEQRKSSMRSFLI